MSKDARIKKSVLNKSVDRTAGQSVPTHNKPCPVMQFLCNVVFILKVNP